VRTREKSGRRGRIIRGILQKTRVKSACSTLNHRTENNKKEREKGFREIEKFLYTPKLQAPLSEFLFMNRDIVTLKDIYNLMKTPLRAETT
jgi:hypothetical protein